MFTFDQFVHITQGKVAVNNSHGQIEHFLTDSRKIVNPKASVFIAIKGEQHDGHDYLNILFEKGIRTFIVEDELLIPANVLNNSSILVVEKSIGALQEIAAFHRRKFQYPVIGVTGSNGKTIIKEWLGQLLGEEYKVIKSPKSYNSQLGVPLSVLGMSDRNNLAIFEAGISTTDEMGRLQEVIRPTIGIFANIGSAHDEGFLDRKEKIKEKWKLFKDCETVIYCADHDQIHQSQPDHLNTFTWGKDKHADIRITSVEKNASEAVFRILYKNESLTINVPFADEASLENVMHCIALMLLMEVPSNDISDTLSKLTNVEMRLELKKGINNCYLIDDSYNNDLGGLQIALDFLNNQPGENKRIILSDILQSGLEEKELYQQLNSILEGNNIDSMIGIGEGLMKNASLFSIPSEFFRTTDEFLKELKPDGFINETILIKGARPFGFERISNVLSEKIHRTVLEINLDALNHNLNYYRSKLRDGVKLMVMVKAASYGNGSFEIANLLQFNRVDYLAVAYADEGVELRKHGIEMPIMVMNVTLEGFGNILKYNLEPEVYSISQLMKLIDFIGTRKKSIKIHIKIDSGMHRLGFEEKEIETLIKILNANPAVQVASIYSHLAGADEEKHTDFSRFQVENFRKVANQIEKGLTISTLKHILNSAGILRFPDFQLDMVRLGIGLYGFEANQLEQGELLPISTLKTVISQVKRVKAGETIGYGRKGVAVHDTSIATIAIGYADGFLRAFSNGKISLLVNGQPAPVIGNICMDMCMIDLQDCDAKEGDDKSSLCACGKKHLDSPNGQQFMCAWLRK
jgi:alanine racemase